MTKVKVTKNKKEYNEYKLELTTTLGKLETIIHALWEYRKNSVLAEELYQEIKTVLDTHIAESL